MNGNKLFAASIAILALALGFFLGNLHIGCGCCCQKAAMPCCNKMESPCPRQGMMPSPPSGAPHHPGEMLEGPHGGPQGDFKGPGPKGFRGPVNPELIDSLLQVTPEQKAAIEAGRVKGDSIFKDLRKNKHEAEKALGEALESGDNKAIDEAKAKVLEADKALLEHRINGVKALAKILSKEQRDKFNQIHKEQMKKFREFKKMDRLGPKGPGPKGPHGGPHGEMLPPPSQE